MTESTKDAKVKYVFNFWWTNQEKWTEKVELLKPTTPKNFIFMPFVDQTTTWRPNHTILTLGVKEILKAMFDTVFWDQV